MRCRNGMRLHSAADWKCADCATESTRSRPDRQPIELPYATGCPHQGAARSRSAVSQQQETTRNETKH